MIVFVLATLLHAAVPAKPASKAVKIAILNLETKAGFDKGRADVFIEFLQNELRARGYVVIGRSDIEAIVGLEQTKQTLGCSSSQCLAELGGALGVDELLTGQLAKLDPYITVTLKRIDPKQGMVKKQIAKKLDGKPESAMIDAVPGLVGELFGGSIMASAATTEQATHGGVVARFVVAEGDDYEVNVIQDGVKTTCPATVTKTSPCELGVGGGKSEIQLKSGDRSKKFKYTYPASGAVIHHLALRSDWTFWAGLGATLGGGTLTLVGLIYQCGKTSATNVIDPASAATTPAWCPLRTGLVASGLAIAGVGLGLFIYYAVAGGNVSKHERVSHLGPLSLRDLEFLPSRDGLLGTAAFSY